MKESKQIKENTKGKGRFLIIHAKKREKKS